MPASGHTNRTSLWIPGDLLKRVDRAAKRHDRTRSWMVRKYVEDGLKRDERNAPREPEPKGAFE